MKGEHRVIISSTRDIVIIFYNIHCVKNRLLGICTSEEVWEKMEMLTYLIAIIILLYICIKMSGCAPEVHRVQIFNVSLLLPLKWYLKFVKHKRTQACAHIFLSLLEEVIDSTLKSHHAFKTPLIIYGTCTL